MGFHVGGEMTRSAASKASTKEGRSRDPPASEYLVRVRGRGRGRSRVGVGARVGARVGGWGWGSGWV